MSHKKDLKSRIIKQFDRNWRKKVKRKWDSFLWSLLLMTISRNSSGYPIRSKEVWTLKKSRLKRWRIEYEMHQWPSNQQFSSLIRIPTRNKVANDHTKKSNLENIFLMKRFLPLISIDDKWDALSGRAGCLCLQELGSSDFFFAVILTARAPVPQAFGVILWKKKL